jgi:hypothetical protein
LGLPVIDASYIHVTQYKDLALFVGQYYVIVGA